jgi:Calcineurin-like phosphoesterase
VMSDLHLTFPGSKGLPPLVRDVDGVLIAGDIREGMAEAVEVLRPAYPEPTEIVIVAGNHEFYSGRLAYHENLALGREAARRNRVHLLERDVCHLPGNVRIIGCTMCGLHVRSDVDLVKTSNSIRRWLWSFRVNRSTAIAAHPKSGRRKYGRSGRYEIGLLLLFFLELGRPLKRLVISATLICTGPPDVAIDVIDPFALEPSETAPRSSAA